MKFSFYNAPIGNKYPSKNIDVKELIDMIKSGKYKEQIDIIKAEPNKDKRTKLKSKLLDYVTIGGVFKERARKNLVNCSGLGSVDIDGLDDIGEVLNKLRKDKHTRALFLSPSYTGVKVVFAYDVKDDTPEGYEEMFLRYCQYLETIGIPASKIDKPTKDVSRACFLSYDTNAYYNPNSLMFVGGKIKEEVKKRQKGGQGGVLLSPLKDEAKGSSDEQVSKIPPYCIVSEKHLSVGNAFPSDGKSRHAYLDAPVKVYCEHNGKPDVLDGYSKSQGRNKSAFNDWEKWDASKGICGIIRTYLIGNKENEFVKAALDDCNECKEYKEYITTPLKNIDVVPNKEVRTKILVSDISPGINLLKGYKATCSKCGKKKVVFTKNLKHCSTLFTEEHEEQGTTPCFGPKDGLLEVSFESINDTGYLCTAYDPEDTGGNPQFTTIFFSNKVIPSNKKERFDFETDIQTKNMIIDGRIKILPSTKKVTEWFIDVEKYKFEEKEVNIDYELLAKHKAITKDSAYFSAYFTPKVYGRTLQKKISALDILSSYKVKLPNGIVEYGVTNNIEIGDQGQSKTVLQLEVNKYCADTQTKLIHVENLTMRGLIGAAVKSPNTGQWMIKAGELALTHQARAVLDGYGKLSEYDQTQLRSIQEEKKFEIIKAGSIKKELAVRMYNLGNQLNPVSQYSTKHKASFDLAATTRDNPHKFSGPDRRRYFHITVSADADTDAGDIDTHLYTNYKPDVEVELLTYWNNIRAFAWNISENDFVWEKEIIKYSQEKIDKLRKEYAEFVLDYGILSKGGLKMFLVQLPAVAILHGSINEEHKVIITKKHVEWLNNLYIEELRDLGLDQENNEQEFYEIHANAMLEVMPAATREILTWIFRYGSQSAVEKADKISRMGIYREFRNIITYTMTDQNKEDKTINYAPQFGSGSIVWKGLQDNQYAVFEEPDGMLQPVCKANGTLTTFGRILIQKAAKVKP